SRTLVDRRKVCVHVARVATAAGNLFTGATDFAQRLTVVGHVGKDDQYVIVVLECQVLSGGQCHLRRKQTFHRGVVSLVQEQDRTCERTGAFEFLGEEGQFALGDT